MYLIHQTMHELSTIWSVQNLKESSLNGRWQRIHEQRTFCSPISKARKKGNVVLEIYMEGLGMYVIMIIDFGVFGNSRCVLHDPDGIVVVPIMNMNQCCHIEVHPWSLFKNLVSCWAQLQPAQLVLILHKTQQSWCRAHTDWPWLCAGWLFPKL